MTATDNSDLVDIAYRDIQTGEEFSIQIPKRFNDYFMWMIGQNTLQSMHGALSGVLERMSTLHSRGKKKRCQECGMRWPCATLRVIGLPIEEEELPTSDDKPSNEPTETKEGETCDHPSHTQPRPKDGWPKIETKEN